LCIAIESILSHPKCDERYQHYDKGTLIMLIYYEHKPMQYAAGAHAFRE